MRVTVEEANALVEAHLSIAEAVARERCPVGGDLDEYLGQAQMALVEVARLFDPGRSHNGTAGFGPWAVERVRWEMNKHAEAAAAGKRAAPGGAVASLDVAPEGEDTLGAEIADPRQSDPALEAEAREAMGLSAPTPKKRRRLTLSEVEVLAPTKEAGAWVATMQAAARSAVGTGDIADIVGAVVRKAKTGNVGAARFVMDYFTGGMRSTTKQSVIVQEADPEEE